MTDGKIGAAENSFQEDQRSLGELYRKRLDERPSQRRIAEALNVSPTSVGKWLKGETVPQRGESMANLVEQIRTGLEEKGINPDQLESELLDPQRWRARHRAVMQERSKLVSAHVKGSAAVKTIDAETTLERFEALPDKPRPVTEWTAQQLGVHAAVHGPAGSVADHEFVLPPYVERAHDHQFRGLLTAAAGGQRTVAVVLRGGSCAGKTRTGFEGVNACLTGWQLVFPKDSESLVALLAAEAVPPRTVLWLNEAQEFLRGPSGESAAAGLRRLLETAGPVVVVATLWPTEHGELTKRGDANAQARAVVRATTVVDVPDVFTAAELRAVEDLHDASLDTAIMVGRRGTITQTLAAGPQLVDHYTSAVPPRGAYGKAVITAAIDVRRLGHASPVSSAFLKAAAPGYLTEQQRATADSETWFEDALAYAREKVMDVAQALEAVTVPDGMGALPGVYRLNDFLDHHARAARRCEFPPDSFWEAAQEHAASAGELTALGNAAAARGRYQIAARVYRRAGDGGASAALVRLGHLHKASGDLAQARALFREAADGGEWFAWQLLVQLEEEAGNAERAEALLREGAVLAKDSACRWILAERLERAGQHDEAEALAREADPQERVRLLHMIADLRVVFGDVAGAELLFRETGGEGLYRLAGRRKHAGDLEEAESLLRQAARDGCALALYDLAELRREADDMAEAGSLLRQAVAAGVTTAMWDLALEAEEAGDRAEADRLARLAGADGDPGALRDLALMRDSAGHHEEAEKLAGEADRAGGEVLYELAIRREQAGDRSSAERLAREAAALGNPTVLRELVRLREESGDRGSADVLARGALDAGDPEGLRHLVSRRLESRDFVGAKHLVMDAVNCGHSWALRELAVLCAEIEDPGDAERIERFGLDGDGRSSSGRI